ncbi:MAG: hypothetical protein KDA59_19025, partial [Planctomycetales bacterium]|nr:hypothetical protein [Planctomycetales bacterium]
ASGEIRLTGVCNVGAAFRIDFQSRACECSRSKFSFWLGAGVARGPDSIFEPVQRLPPAKIRLTAKCNVCAASRFDFASRALECSPPKLNLRPGATYAPFQNSISDPAQRVRRSKNQLLS